MLHEIESVEGFGECPPYFRCKKCGRFAVTMDRLGSDCDPEEKQLTDATTLKRLDDEKAMEIKNYETLTWKVCVEPDGKSAWVWLYLGEKSVSCIRVVRRIFETINSAIERTKRNMLVAYNVSMQESGPVFVPYKPRKQ